MAEYGAIKVLTGMLNPMSGISEENLIMILEGLDGLLSVYGGRGSDNPFAEEFKQFDGWDYLEERQCDQHLCEDAYDTITNFIEKFEEDDRKDLQF